MFKLLAAHAWAARHAAVDLSKNELINGIRGFILTWDASPFQFHKFGGGVSRTKRLILPIVYCLHDKKSAADQIGESIGEIC